MLALLSAILSPEIDLLNQPLRVPDQLRKADVVVAISAGKLHDCKAHPNLFLREGYAAMLLRNGYSGSGKLIISGIYTDPAKVGLNECQAQLAHLLKVPADKIIIDNTAQTTLDNAKHVKALLHQYGWKTAVLVTSQSHMFRASHVFRKQGMRVYPVSIPDMPPYGNAWFNANRRTHLKRFLYEYGALVKYKWYGYI